MNKKIFASIIAATLFVASIVIHHHHSSASVSEITAIPVRVQLIQTQPLSITTTATGYLQAQESTTLTPKISGYVQAIFVHPGDSVTAGNALFQLDNEKEKNALSAAIANNTLSQLQCQRNKELFKKGFITHDEYYTSLVNMKQNEAALQAAQINLSDKIIRAPFSGTIGTIHVSLGDFINPGTALTELVDDQHLQVTYTLPVKYLNDIHLNQLVTIINEDSTYHTVGKIIYISPTIDQTTQTITVQALLEKPASVFKSGEFVTITQQIGKNLHAILIPEQSISGSINGYSVFVTEHNTAIQKPVTIGEHQNGLVFVQSGLKVNELLITTGQDHLQNGQTIKIITDNT